MFFNDFPVTLAHYTPGLSDFRTSIDGHPTGFYGSRGRFSFLHFVLRFFVQIEDVERGAELSFSGRGPLRGPSSASSSNFVFYQPNFSPKVLGFTKVFWFQTGQTDRQTDRQTQ